MQRKNSNFKEALDLVRPQYSSRQKYIEDEIYGDRSWVYDENNNNRQSEEKTE